MIFHFTQDFQSLNSALVLCQKINCLFRCFPLIVIPVALEHEFDESQITVAKKGNIYKTRVMSACEYLCERSLWKHCNELSRVGVVRAVSSCEKKEQKVKTGRCVKSEDLVEKQVF